MNILDNSDIIVFCFDSDIHLSIMGNNILKFEILYLKLINASANLDSEDSTLDMEVCHINLVGNVKCETIKSQWQVAWLVWQIHEWEPSTHNRQLQLNLIEIYGFSYWLLRLSLDIRRTTHSTVKNNNNQHRLAYIWDGIINNHDKDGWWEQPSGTMDDRL